MKTVCPSVQQRRLTSKSPNVSLTEKERQKQNYIYGVLLVMVVITMEELCACVILLIFAATIIIAKFSERYGNEKSYSVTDMRISCIRDNHFAFLSQ